jgi:hypothetical protein
MDNQVDEEIFCLWNFIFWYFCIIISLCMILNIIFSIKLIRQFRGGQKKLSGKINYWKTLFFKIQASSCPWPKLNPPWLSYSYSGTQQIYWSLNMFSLTYKEIDALKLGSRHGLGVVLRWGGPITRGLGFFTPTGSCKPGMARWIEFYD